jgi:hypothetical protein
MAATNVSVSGGIDLMQVAEFIKTLVQQKNAKKGLEKVGTGQGGQPLAIDSKLMSNPWYQKAVEALTATRAQETGTKTTTDTGTFLGGKFGLPGGGLMAPEGANALTARDRNSIAQDEVAVGQKNAKTSRMAVKGQLEHNARSAQNDNARTLADLSLAISTPGEQGEAIRKLFTGGKWTGNLSSLNTLGADDEARRKAIIDALNSPDGKGGKKGGKQAIPVFGPGGEPVSTVGETYDNESFLRAFSANQSEQNAPVKQAQASQMTRGAFPWVMPQPKGGVKPVSPGPVTGDSQTGGFVDSFLSKFFTPHESLRASNPQQVTKGIVDIGQAVKTSVDNLTKMNIGPNATREQLQSVQGDAARLVELRNRLKAFAPVAQKLGVADTNLLNQINQMIDSVLGPEAKK